MLQEQQEQEEEEEEEQQQQNAEEEEEEEEEEDTCIYTRNAWVLPRRCSLYIYNSQTNDIANYSNSYGKSNKGTRDY